MICTIRLKENRRNSTRMPNQLISCPSSSSSHVLVSILLFILRGTSGATITFINSCDYTIWPGILSNAGSQGLGSTGFELTAGASSAFQAPAGWSGRFWGRTSCNFDSTGKGSCTTGDCGSGQLECNGAGASPPATLAELAVGSGDGRDFYDVSLVDGYNLPVAVAAAGPGAGECAATGCVADLNRRCPPELRVGEGEACRSACDAFGRPEYCCSGAFSSPATCGPSKYSELFKAACPKSYSYAYDDPTSTFTCKGADYVITFCPGSTSQKTTKDSPKTGEAGEGVGGVVPGKEHPSFLPGLIIAEGSRKMGVSHVAPFLSAIAVLVILLL